MVLGTIAHQASCVFTYHVTNAGFQKFSFARFMKVKIKQSVFCFLLGDSSASDLYMPTFRNTLSVPSSKAGVK